MDVPKLIRTALFSLIALVLTGGLMAAQAQDTIIVDEDDPNNFDTVSNGIGAVDEDGDIVAVRAGGYGASPTVSAGFDFVIEARTDDDSGADAVELSGLTVDNGGNTITVRSDGTGFLELAGSGTLGLVEGTVSIDASRDFQFLNGATVERRSGGSISGNPPSFGGNTNVRYDLQDGDITAGLEAPSDFGNGGTLTVEDGVTGGNTVDFPSGRFGTIAINNLSLNDNVTADFRGDLNVDQSASVGPDQSLIVAGALTLQDNNQSLTVDSDPSAPNNDVTDLGSLTLNTNTTAANAPLSGNGQLVVDDAVTFQAVSDGAGDFDQLVEQIDVGGSGNFEIGSIEETAVSDGNATDFTVVDVLNDAGGTVTVAGGGFRQLNNSGTGSTFEVAGDVTTDVEGGFPILNGASNATINISSGNTFTVANDDDDPTTGSSVTHLNSDNGGITGTGTIRFVSGNGGERHVVDAADADGDAGVNVNRLPNVEVAGGFADGNPADANTSLVINGTNDQTDPQSGEPLTAIQVSSLTADSDVNLSSSDGKARVGGALTLNGGGTTNLTGVADAVSTADAILNGSSTLNTNANRLEIRRDFSRNNSNATLSTDGSSVVAFTAGGTDGTFDTETLFTINGTVLVSKPDATITLQEAVRVDGDVEIADQGQFLNTTLRLNDNLFLTGNGQLTIDSNLDATGEDNFVVFENTDPAPNRYTVAGDDTLDNAIFEGGNDVVIDPSASSNTNTTSLKFDGLLSLRDGGVTIASNADLSPADASGAEVVRTLDGSDGQQIDATTNGGATFNNDEVAYDLTYRGGNADETASELTDAVADLTVTAGTEALLARDVDVNGSLTVATSSSSPGEIDDDGATGPGASRTLTLAGDSTTHTIDGYIGGTTGEPVTLEVAGEDITVNGGAGTNSFDSTVENVLISAPGATISGLQQILGTLNVDGGDLELGLRAVNGPDQTVGGKVTVNDSLALAADAEFASSSGDDDVKVTSSGRINVGASELAITGSGADFDGDDGAQYYSGGEDGIVRLDGTSTPTLTTAGEAIPRLQIDDAIELSGDVATDVLLDADDNVDLAGSAFDFSGDAELAANVTGTSSGSVFRALGTTLRVEGAIRQVSNFEVDSDTSTVNLTNDQTGPESASSNFLQVTNRFTMSSGTFDYAANMVLTGSLEPSDPGGIDEFVYNGGDFQLTKGYIVLRSNGTSDVSAPETVASFDIEQDSTLSIPNLGVRDNAELSDEQNLVITNDLRIFDTFNTSSQGGRLVIADGATVDRRAPAAGVSGDTNPDEDILDEKLAFQDSEATYNLEYSGGQPITSGRELADDQSRIQDLTIGRRTGPTTTAPGEVFLADVQSSPGVTGDVTVNGTLSLLDGALDYGRQVVVADSATVVRSDGALEDVTDASSSDAGGETPGDGGEADGGPSGSGFPASINAPGFYTLVYDGTGSRTATGLEFLSGGDVELVTRVGTPPPLGPTSGSVEIPFSRTVTDLTVANQTGGSATSIGGSTGGTQALTVTGEAEVTGGSLSGDDLVDQGDLAITGGSVSTFTDIEGNTLVSGGSFDGFLRTAGDVVTESVPGTALSPSTLEFDGTEQDLTLNGGAANVDQLALSQQNGGDGRVYLTGDEVVIGDKDSDAIDFNSGLLVVPDSVDQNEVLVELSSTSGNGPDSSIPFDRSDVDDSDPNDLSHIVGRVRVGVPSGTPTSSGVQRGRFEFPVGTMDEYRPGAFTFRTDDPTEVNTDIVVGHVPMNAGGTEGLPLDGGTDDQGNQVTIGQNYPDQYWFVSATTGLGPSQEFDLELETGTSGFVNQFEDASQLRLIRRFSGDAQQNQWRLQAGDVQDPGTQYDNTLIRRNDKEFTNIRSRSSTGGITANAALFTVGVPTEVTADLFTIAGSVTYPVVENDAVTGGRSLSGVEVEATSADTTVTDTTDSDGSYRITGLPAGDYDVEPTVSDSVENVSTADALRAVRGFAGIDAFAGSFQEQVADVNGSGGVNATDALQIARFDLGLTDGFSVGSFVTESETIVLGDSSASGVELFAAEAGDVRLDGGETGGSSQTLAASTLSPEQGLSAARTQSASSGASEAAVEAGETFEVPVRMGRGAEVGAYQMTVNYDSDIASFDGVKAAQEGVLTNASEDGTVQVSWFDQSGESALELRDGSDLVTLQFTASEDAAETDFSPEVKSGEITGPDAAPISAGVELQAVSIGAPAPDEFALNGSYPNPVQGQATIEMDIPSKASVTIEVYNVLGQRVQTMEQSMSAGSGQTIQLDGSNLASGQYFYRVEADLEDGSAQKSGRITVVK
ncbi:T9SS type A sorting domain-containing protein [Salinibacter ruber]|uniref:T9SS type A sorting domain-containing protein n=1 Tax=Salinibacter ruber TaxID=146919 RepID=UPI00207340EA|nr:T9SS type A sorting domain-containing protein [Salinibacter ruber]